MGRPKHFHSLGRPAFSRLCPGTNRRFSGPSRSVPGRFFPSGVQVPLEVAQGMYPLLDHEERMGVHLPDLLPPRRPGGLNTINGLPGRKSSGEPARLSEMPLPEIHRKLTQKPSFSACDGVCFMVYCKNTKGFLPGGGQAEGSFFDGRRPRWTQTTETAETTAETRRTTGICAVSSP